MERIFEPPIASVDTETSAERDLESKIKKIQDKLDILTTQVDTHINVFQGKISQDTLGLMTESMDKLKNSILSLVRRTRDEAMIEQISQLNEQWLVLRKKMTNKFEIKFPSVPKCLALLSQRKLQFDTN